MLQIEQDTETNNQAELATATHERGTNNQEELETIANDSQCKSPKIIFQAGLMII